MSTFFQVQLASAAAHPGPLRLEGVPTKRPVSRMLAGSGQGYFKTGQCAVSTGNPIGGVLAHIYNAMIPDAPVTYFGDATYGKPWDGLRA